MLQLRAPPLLGCLCRIALSLLRRHNLQGVSIWHCKAYVHSLARQLGASFTGLMLVLLPPAWLDRCLSEGYREPLPPHPDLVKDMMS